MTKPDTPLDAALTEDELLQLRQAQEANHAAIAAFQRQQMVLDFQRSMTAVAPVTIALFTQLGSIATAWSTEQGFWDSTNFGEKLALVHSEISEALEAHRKDLPSDHIQGFHGVEEELADAMIRIFDIAAKHNIRLGEAFVAKFNFNLTRPYKHGKAY